MKIDEKTLIIWIVIIMIIISLASCDCNKNGPNKPDRYFTPGRGVPQG